MTSPISDIAPDVAALLVEHWRATPVWQKLNAVHELNETLKVLALSDLRRRYPRAADADLQRHLAARWLGPALTLRLYGPLPEHADAAN